MRKFTAYRTRCQRMQFCRMRRCGEEDHRRIRLAIKRLELYNSKRSASTHSFDNESFYRLLQTIRHCPIHPVPLLSYLKALLASSFLTRRVWLRICIARLCAISTRGGGLIFLFVLWIRKIQICLTLLDPMTSAHWKRKTDWLMTRA